MAAFAGPKLVISQVYGGGGNSGAPLTHDFVELYNAGDAAASLDGMSVQYASATGTGAFGNGTSQTVAVSGTINPGNYFLIRLAGGSSGVALRTPDAIGTINASGSAGKFALVSGTSSLGCNGGSIACSPEQLARIVDLIGFGSANFFEGAGAAPGLSNTTAAFRKADGAQDTDNNAADFVAATPAPRNSATTPVVVGPLEAVSLPASPSVDQFATISLSATATDADGIAITAGTMTWIAENSNVTVTSTGPRAASVRGNAIGTSVITASLTVDGITRSATTTVTVNTPPPPGAPASVDVTNYPPMPLPIGFEFQVFATIRDAKGATIFNAPRNWSSNQPNVAIVDPMTGVIRAVGEGRAYIVSEPAPGVRDSIYADVGNVTESTTARFQNHLEFGRPTDASPEDDFIVSRREFVASWNRSRGQSNWVAYNLEATHRGPAERCDCFTADPLLPPEFPRVVYTDYTGSGYSRGHMTMSEDRTAGGSATTTSLDNARTFYMTNIIPQTSANNGGPWLNLEIHLGNLAKDANKEIFIIAGGAKYEGTLANSGGRVAIPTWTWKIAVILPRDAGLGDVTKLADAEIIAVSMPNSTSMPNGNLWGNYRVSVDSVESLTGYDFLSLLPNPLEEIIESGDRAPTASVTAVGGAEGEMLTFDGSGSTDPDIGGPLMDALSYSWIINGHVTSTSATVTGSFPDNGTVNIVLIVTDKFGWADTASTSVVITNVVPTIASIAGATILEGETYSAASSFADPGADSWTATVNYGDGTGTQSVALSGTAFTLSHRYTTAGTFTVAVVVTDDDAGVGTGNATVTVQSSLQGVSNLSAIIDAVAPDELSGLNGGQLQSLRAKLNAAAGSLRRDNGAAAAGQLNAFINELEAMAGTGRLSVDASTSIISYAQRVIRSIEG